MNKIKFLSLGGLDEKGNNFYVLELNSKIFIIDAGYQIPDNKNLGTEYIIPQTKYLELNKDKIKGVFISHGDLLNFGSLMHIYQNFKNIPVYCSEATKHIIDYNFKQQKIALPKTIVVDEDTKITIEKDIHLSFIKLTSSLPGNLGAIFTTKAGNILYFTDFIFDLNSSKPSMNIAKLNQLANEKNNILLLDSTNMLNNFLTNPNDKIASILKSISWKGVNRLVVGLYRDSVFNVIEVIKYAKSLNKKVFIYGEEILDLLEFLKKNKYFNLDFEVPKVLNEKNNKIKNSILIFIDSIDKIYQDLEEAAAGTLEGIILDKQDMVIIPEPIFAGIEKVASNVVDDLTKAEILQAEPNSATAALIKKKVLTSPSIQDSALMLKILKPEYVVPINGFYKDLLAVKNFASEFDFVKEVPLLINGQVISFNNGVYDPKSQELIKDIGKVNVDALGSQNLHGELLIERTKLAKEGCVVFSVLYDSKKNKTVSKIDLQLRGVIYIKKNQQLIDDLTETFTRILNKNIEMKTVNKVKQEATPELIKIIKTATKKTPILEINILKY